MRAAIYPFILIALFGTSELRPQSTGRPRQDAKAAKSCNNPPVDPLSLAAVINLVFAKPDCVVQYVRKAHVDFYGTADYLKILRGIQAPDGIFDEIKPPPEPEKPKPAGPLTIFCSPDCEVIVNERYYGRTQDGKKVVPDLAPGEAKVHVRSEGYEPQTTTAEMKEGAERQEPFTLRPNAATRRDRGRDLLLRVAAKFGGLQGVFELASLQVPGNTMALDGKGQPQQWDTSFWPAWNRASIRFAVKPAPTTKTAKQASPSQCDILISGTTKSSTNCTGSLKGSKEADLLVNTAEVLRKYQVHAVLAELLSRNVEVSDAASAAAKVQTTDGTDSFVLSLGADGFPSVVLHRPKPDANPIKIEYTDYSLVEGRQYPHRTKISETSPEKLLADFTVAPAVKPEPPSNRNSPQGH